MLFFDGFDSIWTWTFLSRVPVKAETPWQKDPVTDARFAVRFSLQVLAIFAYQLQHLQVPHSRGSRLKSCRRSHYLTGCAGTAKQIGWTVDKSKAHMTVAIK